jgi:hypothetical protein
MPYADNRLWLGRIGRLKRKTLERCSGTLAQVGISMAAIRLFLKANRNPPFFSIPKGLK